MISIVWFFLLMTVVINAYMSIIKFRYAFQARANLLENTYYMVERVNLLLKDYTVDYEEYFNRKNVGCDSWYQTNFLWNVWINWYCDNFTAYWNNNNLSSNTWVWQTYFCSSTTGYSIWSEYVIKNSGDLLTWWWCLSSWYQAYWQYYFQFVDMKNDSDSVGWVVGDWDDTDIWQWPNAIVNATGVKEIYLTSPDKKNRVFIRRRLLWSWDFDWNGSISGDNEYLYTLEILKLKAFDAWNKHNFNIAISSGVYDSNTDTRACDYSQWFTCSWTWIGNVYSWYRLPANQNDWRVSLFDNSITVSEWNVIVYPTIDPDYWWMNDNVQINPYFTVYIKTKLYSWVWQKRLAESTKNFEFALQTTFDTKNNYIKK